MNSFSIVIPSYNGKEYLKKCLLALKSSTLKPDKIIIVDDCSVDGTSEMITKEFSEVVVARNPQNSGPTISRNRGAELTEGGYIIFIDNDVLVRKETCNTLIEFLKTYPQAGLVGAKIIPEGKEKIWWNMGYDFNHFRTAAGYFIGFLLKIFPKSAGLKNTSTKFILNYWDYDKTLEVDWVIEMCFAVRKDVFNKIGGFDENFFIFHEGPDLCKRIRNSGYKVYFYPEAIVDALERHTHSLLKRKKWFLKSEYYYYKKHYFYKKSNPLIFWLGRFVSSLFYLIG